jgi:hypothetical protein
VNELQFADVIVGAEMNPSSVDGKYTSCVNILVNEPVTRDRLIEVTGKILNVRSTSARICIASSGLAVGPPSDPRVRYTGVLRPAPAPPPPLVLELPAESSVPVAGAWNTQDWTWEGAILVEMWWSISLVPGPHVTGRFRITLPSR